MFQLALFTSLFVCLSLIAASSVLLRLFHRPDLQARQAAHSRPTLRLGGVGVLAGLWVAVLLAKSDLLLLLMVASVPIAVSGLSEDLGYAQSARQRLIWASVSSLLAVAFLGVSISRVGIENLDPLFAIYPFAVAFTLFAAVGVVNAYNLVDGINGLAGTAALVCLGGLSLIVVAADYTHLLQPIAIIAAAICGFLVLNYPAGKIFLGDAGAYTIGFLLAWLAIYLLYNQTEVSPWAVLLVFFWPVAETLFSIWRRFRRNAKAFHPDRMHFHHVVMRAIEIRLLGRRNRSLSNPLATLVILPLMVCPATVGVLAWNDNTVAALSACGFAVLFVAIYRTFVDAGRKRRPYAVRQTARGLRSPQASAAIPEA